MDGAGCAAQAGRRRRLYAHPCYAQPTSIQNKWTVENALRSSWERLQDHAKASTSTDGHYARATTRHELRGPACRASHRQLQSALTKEVELVKYGELVAELVKLHQHDRRRESHRAVFQNPVSVWVTAWPRPRQQPAGCACCMVHGGAGGASSANDRPEAPEGRSG
jgi:hypothetical protein